MAAIKDVNWEVIQGDTWSVEIDVTDSLNAPINWTGYTFYMEVRDKDGGSILCATAALNDGITVASPFSGILQVELTPAKTRQFNYPRSRYQIQAIDVTGRRTTLLCGWFMVQAGVIS